MKAAAWEVSISKGKAELGVCEAMLNHVVPLSLDGGGEDAGYGIAADTSGNAYVTSVIDGGLVSPTKFYDTSYGGANDAFFIKLKTTVTTLSSGLNLYATYLGGTGADQCNAVAIDASGNAYVTGGTASSGSSSTGFPTLNPYQGSNAVLVEAFVVKINPNALTNTATLAYATYPGGGASDAGNDIAVDSSGNAYVTGYVDSTNFPTLTP